MNGCLRHCRWQLETQWTAHFHLHTRVQVGRGRWEGVCPYPQLCLRLSFHGNRLRLETTGERNHGVCFSTSYELRFCHCLYMDIFKEYLGMLCAGGRLNGLWWKESAEADCFICALLRVSFHAIYYIQLE